MKQINLKEYLSLPLSEQIIYASLLTQQRPFEAIKIKINELTYNEVKQCFKELKKDNCNIELIFTMSLKITSDEYFSLPIQKYFQLKKFIDNFFISLYQREIDLLNSINEDAELWSIAGGDELNEYADVLPISQLAKIYGGYPFDLVNRNYIEIIYLLRMNNKQGQVENEFNKLKAKKK